MASVTKARCWTCRVVFYWDGLPLVRDALCPRCGKPLNRTTHDALDPKVRGELPRKRQDVDVWPAHVQRPRRAPRVADGPPYDAATATGMYDPEGT